MSLIRTFSWPSATSFSIRAFFALLGRIEIGHLTVTTPDGASYVFGNSHQQPAATLVLRDWRACGAILRGGDIGFGQAYRNQWLDSPDMLSLLRVALQNGDTVARAVVGSRVSQIWYNIRHRIRPNSKTGSRRNIHAHYDIGNAFYGLWLDPTWTYSSAWFDGDTTRSLEAAQAAKYQRIVDTLELRPGMRVLEIGCGWGGFARHAARLGIHVHGLTISNAQFEFVTEQAAREGLSDQIDIELRDYRDVHGQYDAIVSIEMFEAVGERYWSGYFSTLKRCLARGGRALVQTITIDDSRFAAYRASSDFIREYIFPGGMLPSPERFVRAAQRAGIETHPTLRFGQDYGRTLRLWHAAFKERLDEVRALGLDDTFVRTWSLYFDFCEAGFAEQRTDVMHFLLTT